MTQGLSALFLSLRRRPVIRYQTGSDAVVRLALSLYHLLYKEVSIDPFSKRRLLCVAGTFTFRFWSAWK